MLTWFKGEPKNFRVAYVRWRNESNHNLGQMTLISRAMTRREAQAHFTAWSDASYLMEVIAEKDPQVHNLE